MPHPAAEPVLVLLILTPTDQAALGRSGIVKAKVSSKPQRELSSARHLPNNRPAQSIERSTSRLISPSPGDNLPIIVGRVHDD